MQEDARGELDRDRYRMLVSQLRQLTRRVECAERRTRQIENAVSGMSESIGSCSLGPPCAECQQSLLISTNGELRCPRCSFRRTM